MKTSDCVCGPYPGQIAIFTQYTEPGTQRPPDKGTAV